MTVGPIKRLVGSYVSEVSREHPELWLRFRDGGRLRVMNPWVLSDGASVTFGFDGRVTLAVDLREEVWAGPEAVVAWLPDGTIIVW